MRHDAMQVLLSRRDELTAEEEETLQQHLVRCGECSDLSSAFAEQNQLLRALASPEMRPTFESDVLAAVQSGARVPQSNGTSAMPGTGAATAGRETRRVSWWWPALPASARDPDSGLMPRVDSAYRHGLQSRQVAAPAPRHRWRLSVPWRAVPRAVPVLAAIVLLAVALLGHSRTQHSSGTTPAVPNGQIPGGWFSVSKGKIAFVEVSGPTGNSRSSLDVINPDGSGLRRLVRCTTRPCNIADPIWSPDGRRIAFLRGRGVYVVNANGSGERPVESCRGGSCGGSSLAWAPDSAHLAIGGGQSLYVLNVKTGQMRRLMRCAFSPCWDESFAWSPDGSKIVFARSRTSCVGACPSSPWVVNADGSGARQLAHVMGYGSKVNPQWSPNGRAIAFSGSSGNFSPYKQAIYAVNPDGVHLRVLVPAPPTGTNQLQTLGGWSDERHILYVRTSYTSKGPQASALWVMNGNFDASIALAFRRLYRVGHASIADATWDGGRIVFSVGSPSTQKFGLLIMDPDGSHVQRIFP